VRSFDLRILVVEDNVEISEALSFFCGARKDIECEVINTGEVGLDRIRVENFDLILLDLAMPDFSGMDVIKSLKQDGLIESRNIVIFTASSNPERSVVSIRLQPPSVRQFQKLVFLQPSGTIYNSRRVLTVHGLL
jgi:two-component system, OmpR family, response regulator